MADPIAYHIRPAKPIGGQASRGTLDEALELLSGDSGVVTAVYLHRTEDGSWFKGTSTMEVRRVDGELRFTPWGALEAA